MLSVEDAIYKVKQAITAFAIADFNANVEPDSFFRREKVEKAEKCEDAIDRAIENLMIVVRMEQARECQNKFLDASRLAIITKNAEILRDLQKGYENPIVEE